ncbi:MAG: HAD-IA family hydrolase [Candidatus Longimicrobiales bacterium M2_2A_002]
MTDRRPNVLFMDVGGVLLTNGWDSASRSRAAARFELDRDAMEARHEAVLEPFETARITVDDYLDHVVFHRPRDFDRSAFRRFMEGQSRPHGDAIALAARLGRVPGLAVATLNNESLVLNRYRIETFGLRPLFVAFFSSCFVGIRKPNPDIYRLAVRVMQDDPDACLFVDDRDENVEAARGTGLPTLKYRGADWLEDALTSRGIEIPPE